MHADRHLTLRVEPRRPNSGSSRRREEDRECARTAERVALDHRGVGELGGEAEVGQAVEDAVETNAQLETREVHPETLVRTGAEREVVLPGATELPLLCVFPT